MRDIDQITGLPLEEWMPRFVVRELHGVAITPNATVNREAGVTVWVADEAYLGREIRVWHSEDYGAMWRPFKLEKMRSEARALAERLNAEEAAAW